MGRGTGDQFDMRLTERSLDEAGDAIALAATYQRADLIVLIALAGEAQAGNRLAQRVHQLGIDTRLRVDAAGGGAVLAGVVIAVGANAVDHLVEIGVVADDHRRLAPVPDGYA